MKNNALIALVPKELQEAWDGIAPSLGSASNRGIETVFYASPEEAIQLIRKPQEELVAPPKDEMEWFNKRAELRGVDISRYL